MHRHHKVPNIIGPEDSRARCTQQIDRLGARVPEVVARPNADDCVTRRPCSQALRSKTIGAAVMRHLEHLDLSKLTCGEHAVLRGLLRIAGEHDVERSPAHEQDYARIIRGQIARRVGRRPQHLDVGPADAPPVTRNHLANGRVRAAPFGIPRHEVTDPRSLRFDLLLAILAGYPHPTDLGYAAQARHAAGVVLVRVGEHHHVD